MKPPESVWPDGKDFILIYHSGHNTMIYIERAGLSCVSNSIESNFIDSFFIVKSEFHFLSKYLFNTSEDHFYTCHKDSPSKYKISRLYKSYFVLYRSLYWGRKGK